jgi:hypothetical protein
MSRARIIGNLHPNEIMPCHLFIIVVFGVGLDDIDTDIELNPLSVEEAEQEIRTRPGRWRLDNVYLLKYAAYLKVDTSDAERDRRIGGKDRDRKWNVWHYPFEVPLINNDNDHRKRRFIVKTYSGKFRWVRWEDVIGTKYETPLRRIADRKGWQLEDGMIIDCFALFMLLACR